MLTDRQERFIKEMRNLLSVSSYTSSHERAYIGYTIKGIAQGENFKSMINFLIWHLNELEKSQKDGLKPRVKELFENLKATYSMPENEPQYNLAAKSWHDADPDYIFIGRGVSAQGGWQKRIPDAPPSVFSRLFSWIKAFLVLLLILLFWWSPLPSLLVENFGDKGKALSVAITLIILVIGVGVLGRFKRRK